MRVVGVTGGVGAGKSTVLDFLEEQEREGKVFVIRPQAKVEVGRVEKDKAKLTVLYKQGVHDGEQAIEAMKEYLEK